MAQTCNYNPNEYFTTDKVYVLDCAGNHMNNTDSDQGGVIEERTEQEQENPEGTTEAQ